MIHFNFDKDCTGCKACADVCPKHCITFAEDIDGFFMPKVETHYCVECHLCEKVCPALNYSSNTFADRRCYSAFHREQNIRHIGSSGSVFYALGEQIIAQDGVVYGASMDGNLQLRHTRATTLNEVKQQMKSKYIQSDTAGIYRCVQNDLKDGRQVLFVGTPCQCKALDAMTPAKLRDNLFIVDIICHGVPAQSLFNKSIANFEKQHHCKVEDFSFREKTTTALRNAKITYTTSDGKQTSELVDLHDNSYCFAYLQHWSLRKSCYQCKQRSVERPSDITLGDFWGLEKLRPIPKRDFNKGYSTVICNNERGKRFLRANLIVEEIPEGIEHTVRTNHAYIGADKRSLMRAVLFHLIRHRGYSYCEHRFLTKSPTLFWYLMQSIVLKIDQIFQ